MKHILCLTILVLTLACVDAQAQGPSKTCPTCGLSMAKCQYHGKHPKPEGNKPAASKPNKPATKPSASQKQTAGNKINGHEWVDLGLSVNWAACNVGANKPEEYGGLYAWGENNTKSNYSWSNCFDCQDDNGDSWKVYKYGSKTKIAPSSGHDTARQNWGGTWRMPTEAECQELVNECEWQWTSKGGHNGYVVTGPNGNSIFLPAAGFRDGSTTIKAGEIGCYWSSKLDVSDSSYSNVSRYLIFWDATKDVSLQFRYFGQSIRPVTD